MDPACVCFSLCPLWLMSRWASIVFVSRRELSTGFWVPSKKRETGPLATLDHCCLFVFVTFYFRFGEYLSYIYFKFFSPQRLSLFIDTLDNTVARKSPPLDLYLTFNEFLLQSHDHLLEDMTRFCTFPVIWLQKFVSWLISAHKHIQETTHYQIIGGVSFFSI